MTRCFNCTGITAPCVAYHTMNDNLCTMCYLGVTLLKAHNMMWNTKIKHILSKGPLLISLPVFTNHSIYIMWEYHVQKLLCWSQYEKHRLFVYSFEYHLTQIWSVRNPVRKALALNTANINFLRVILQNYDAMAATGCENRICTCAGWMSTVAITCKKIYGIKIPQRVL